MLRPALGRSTLRRRLIVGLGVLVVLSVLAAQWWVIQTPPVSDDVPAEDRHGRRQMMFQAALTQLVDSGGDTIRLDDIELGDHHVETLAQVERLRVIRASGGRLTSAAGRQLAKMPHLEQLHLRQVELDDATLDEIARSESIWLLNLVGAKVSPEAVERLAEMRRLRQLRLAIPAGDNRYAAAVSSIEGLRAVHLIGIGVTSEGLKRLASLPHLESLYLDDALVPDSGWLWLFENHPHLHVHINQRHHDRDPQWHQHADGGDKLADDP